MSTNKPRITITLNQRTYAVVKAISDLGGKPMSAFVSEMLDSALPTLERMAATFQAIKGAQETERGRFLASLGRAQDALEPSVMEAVSQLDLFLSSVDRAASAAVAAPAAPLSDAANPRPVTRGSTPLIRKKSAASTATTNASTRAASGRKS